MMNNKTIKIDLDHKTSKIKIIAATIMVLLLNYNVLLGQNTSMPGGVAGAKLWFDLERGIKMDTFKGVSGQKEYRVSKWENSGDWSGIDLLSQPSNGPVYKRSEYHEFNMNDFYSGFAHSNFNPTLNFFGEEYMRTAKQIPAGVSAHTTFIVTYMRTTGKDHSSLKSIMYFNTSGDNSHKFGFGSWGTNWNYRLQYTNGSEIKFVNGTAPSYFASYILSSRMRNGSNRLKEYIVNSSLEGSINDSNDLILGRTLTIGNKGTTGIEGRIKEIIFFDRFLSDLEQRKVESYLAIKWALPLSRDKDYLSSGGLTVWNPLINRLYNLDQFGIARDDNSSLYQRVARSASQNSLLTVATSNDFESYNNSSRVGIKDDNTYLLFGSPIHNERKWKDDGCGKFLLESKWMVQPTGEVIDAYLQLYHGSRTYFPDEKDYYEMLVSNDPNFTQYEIVPAISKVNFRSVFNYKFADVKYITFREIIASSAGPTIAKANLANNCDDINNPTPRSVNLSEAGVGVAPAGRELRWYKDIDRTQAVDPTDNIDESGEFYAFYYDPTANCYSQPSAKVTVTITECRTCVKPGNPDVSSVFTKVGISSQSNVTQNIPNGFIALESKDKGFVISRVQKASDIIDPKEGMLIYDIEAKCNKLYNGVIWKCIEKKCND